MRLELREVGRRARGDPRVLRGGLDLCLLGDELRRDAAGLLVLVARDVYRAVIVALGVEGSQALFERLKNLTDLIRGEFLMRELPNRGEHLAVDRRTARGPGDLLIPFHPRCAVLEVSDLGNRGVERVECAHATIRGGEACLVPTTRRLWHN